MTKKPTKATSRREDRNSPRKSQQLLVTSKMLLDTRAELKADQTNLRLEMKAAFQRSDARMTEIQAQISELKSMFHRMMVLIGPPIARIRSNPCRYLDL